MNTAAVLYIFTTMARNLLPETNVEECHILTILSDIILLDCLGENLSL